VQPDAKRRTERRGPDRPFHTGRRASDRAATKPVAPGAAVAPIAVVPPAVVLASAPEPVGVTRPPLEVELASAGARARAAHIVIERPDPDFIQKLRAQLVEQLPVTQLLPATAVAPASPTARPAGPSLRERLMPRMALRSNLRHTPSWAFAIAAGLIIGIIALAAGRSLFTPAVPPASRTVDAAGATLIRNGQSIDLAAGIAIQAGDEIRTTADGHAIVALGNSRARLAGGSDLIVTAITASDIALEQVAGRVYHRVWVPAGGSYVVTTAGVSWTAHGTAFDLDRESVPGGGSHLKLLTIENAVIVNAPDISVTVPQGRVAEIVVGVGTDAPNLSTGPQSADVLSDPWLADNAGRDVADGFDPGVLATVAVTGANATPSAEPSLSPSPSPSASPSPTTTATPSVEPTASPSPTPSESPSPTPTPTLKPTPEPTASPTPTQSLDLSVKACPGGTILDWGTATATSFDHYRTYRSSTASFGSPVLVAGTTTSSRTATSGADENATGTRWYRTYAYDADDHIVAKSDTRSASGLGSPDALNPFSVGQLIAHQTEFTWKAPQLPSACGDVTKIVYSSGGNPSYGDTGTKLLTYSGDVGAHEVTLGTVKSGTWWFRVQVIRITALGTVVTAESNPVRYTVP
jgi:hypothetical protein